MPLDSRLISNDDPIVKDNHKYDSLLSVWYKENIVNTLEDFTNEFIDIDLDEDFNPANALPDSIYEQRLNMIASEVLLPYNDVIKKYIITYTTKNRTLMSRIMGLAQYYMPIFEQELDLYGIPDEMKIVPIIESALNPKAMSPVGAGGLWQFMVQTGKSYGLEINSFVDERYDPIKSTKVAAKYLKDLYKIYEDWTLVIAAYNCGPGNVNKAIKRSNGGKTYWEIYSYLPKETRNHIPAFIAATYAYTFHKAHMIEPVEPPYPIATDTVMVNKMMHFNQIATTLNIPIDIIRSLNPQYKLDIVPAKEKEYSITLPLDDALMFVEKEHEIYAKDSIYLAKYQNKTLAQIESAATVALYSSGATVTYKVRSGDNLGAIARKYGTTAQKLMNINGISDPKKLKIGQVLTIK